MDFLGSQITGSDKPSEPRGHRPQESNVQLGKRDLEFERSMRATRQANRQDDASDIGMGDAEPGVDTAEEEIACDGVSSETATEAESQFTIEPEPEIDEASDKLAAMMEAWSGVTSALRTVPVQSGDDTAALPDDGGQKAGMAGSAGLASMTVRGGTSALWDDDAKISLGGDASLRADASAEGDGAQRDRTDLNRAADLSRATWSRVAVTDAQSGAQQIPAGMQDAQESRSMAFLSEGSPIIVSKQSTVMAQQSQPVSFLAPPVVRQISDAIVRSVNDRIEIVLSPEELGRVRMVLSGQDRAPHVVLWAERPETLDQLRRHADVLLQQFGEDGLGDATLDFRGGHDGAAEREDRFDSAEPGAESDDPALPAAGHTIALHPATTGAERRLDIRL